MNLADVAAVYGLAGAAAAVAIYRAAPRPRARALLRAAVAVVLWPIWAPLALTTSTRRRRPIEARASAGVGVDPNVARAEATLAEAVRASAGTPLEALLSADAAARIAREIRAAARRHAEVVAALADATPDLETAEARLATLEAGGGSPRAIATARLNRDAIRRLISLRDHDARALAEIAELVEALKTQLRLARVAGEAAVGPGDLVTELWARVEGLSAATPEPGEAA